MHSPGLCFVQRHNPGACNAAAPYEPLQLQQGYTQSCVISAVESTAWP